MTGFSVCNQCGYRWNHAGGKPPRCPACKSEAYDKEVAPVSCGRGGGICDICETECMVFGIGKDKFCPNCGSEKWASKKQYECLVCGHRWYSMLVPGPTRCPHREYLIDNKTGTQTIKKCRSRSVGEVKENAEI
jgi:predicted Zn-ribbon and HTH transcriptional regulator